MEGSTKENHRQTDLPHDLLAEILSRVPYKSLCRFRCVSRSWHALCSDPDIVKKSTQTLPGFLFFYAGDGDIKSDHRLLNLSGSGRPLLDPPVTFLRHYYGYIWILHSCNGLLLCHCHKDPAKFDEFDLVVSSPATKQWIVLPPNTRQVRGVSHGYHLGFDPAISSNFRVFMFWPDWKAHTPTEGVMIFSSETGGWAYREIKLLGDNNSVRITACSHTVFFNGVLHMATSCAVITVDTEGKMWRRIPLPRTMDYYRTSIGHSQGRLYVTYVDLHNACRLSVWVLEDYSSQQWTLIHTVSILELYGKKDRAYDEFYYVIAIHPECNLVFIIARTTKRQHLVSYNMDKQRVQFICSLDGYSEITCAPYVPYFGESLLSDGH